ncbi:L,D-transpeptidase family protein [Eggerthella lenta]|uniref:L,D-transpeptidase family protein n=1 Tax=Eggerthella lenta TaxID=84112 RepID=UPI00189F8197|nr:L,D-transpeptidase family protein [Eggerthella lenta]
MRYATDQVFKPLDPMRPVDTAQAFAIERKHKPLKILGITFGVIVALLLIAYAGVALYFTDRFMPNSNIGDINVSLMSAGDAEKVLADSIKDYALSIDGQGFSLKLTASDAGLSIDEGKVVHDMLSDMNPWAWPFELQKGHDETAKLVATYNGTGLEDAIRSAVAAFNEDATQPANAAIGFDEAQAAFVVKPEAVGTALDADAVIKAADEAVADLDPQVKLTSEQLLKPTVLSTDPKLTSAADSANTMIKADLELLMAGTVAGTVDASLISQWVSLDDELAVTLDEGALTAWVDELAAVCNTVGTQRTYTRSDGKVVTVAGGTYGWEVDKDALLALVKDGVANGAANTVDIPCMQTGDAYNGAGSRDWGARYMDVDLSEQHARLYDASGAVIWESDIITGKPDGEHDTPTGVYMVNAKQSPSKLIGYNGNEKIYETEVQYWMPFVGNYIGFHDADWQPAFGGTLYADGAGSHGCVNLPPSKAAELYGMLSSGDTVVSHW